MDKHILSDNELEQVVGGNMIVNIRVSSDGSAADYIRQLLEAKPQLMNSQDRLMDIAAQMDRDGKKIAYLEFDRDNRLISVRIG